MPIASKAVELVNKGGWEREIYIAKDNMLTTTLQENILHPNDKTSMEAASTELLMFFLMILEIQTRNSCGALRKGAQMSISTCNGIISILTKESCKSGTFLATC